MGFFFNKKIPGGLRIGDGWGRGGFGFQRQLGSYVVVWWFNIGGCAISDRSEKSRVTMPPPPTEPPFDCPLLRDFLCKEAAEENFGPTSKINLPPSYAPPPVLDQKRGYCRGAWYQ